MKQKNIYKAFSIVALVLSLSISAYAQGLSEGLNLINKEKYNAAFEFFNAKLASEPNNAEILYRLGEVKFLQEKNDEAKTYYEKGVAANADYPLNYVGIAKTFLAKKDTASARGFIDKALACPNFKNSLNLDIAEAYAVTGQNLNEAIMRATEGMKPEKKSKAPKNPYGYYVLGTIYEKLNNGSEAIKNYELAIDLDPKNIRAKLGAASIYIAIKNYDEAKGYYLRALGGVDSTNPVANKEFAQFYYDQNKYAQALYYHERYVRNTEKTSSNLYRLATLYYLNKDLNKTVEVIKDYMQINDKNYGMLRLLSYSYYDLGDFQSSVDAFKKYFSVADSTQTIAGDYEKYGNALLKTNQEALAIPSLKKSADMDSTKADLYTVIGEILFKEKKYQEAIPYYALKIKRAANPGTNDYLKEALCYYMIQDFVNADTAFGMVIKILPNEPFGYFWKARVKSNLDSASVNGLARPYYEKAIEYASVDPKKNKNILIESYQYLGSYFIQKDEIAQSKQMWEKLLTVDPENETAKQVLNRAEFKKIK